MTPPNVWWQFLASSPKDNEIKDRVAEDFKAIIDRHNLGQNYAVLALLEPENSINAFDLDRIYQGLTSINATRQKDVLLILLSRGGEIEPAYQISKLCKAFSRQKFIAAVPRKAKSAATLIALGADEIHMGPLGHLGPIDPQLGGLPALGVTQALERIAAVAQQFPGSAGMLAQYLRLALTVEQIGYCDRIAQSAEQYAQRLLKSKGLPEDTVKRIAKELVHEYKDHGFIIDIAEAREHFGNTWIKDASPEIQACEEIYSAFTNINSWLDAFVEKTLLVIGKLDAASDVLLLNKQP